MSESDFKLSEGAATNPANLPLAGTELVFMTQMVGGVAVTVVTTAGEIAKLGLSPDDLAAVIDLIDAKAPISHTHNADAIDSGVLADARIPNLQISKITNLPTTLGQKSDVGHQHQIADVVGLQDALDNAGGGGAGIDDGTTATNKVWSSKKTSDELGGKAATSHTHSADAIDSGTFNEARIPEIPISRVTGLQTALDNAGGGGGMPPPESITGAVALGAGHLNKILERTAAGTTTIAANIGTFGDTITFVNNTAASVTIARGSGVVLYRYGLNADLAIPARRTATIFRSSTNNTWFCL